MSSKKEYMGVSKNRGGKPPNLHHLFIGFGTIIFTIHFGGFPPICGNTHIIKAVVFGEECPCSSSAEEVSGP